MCVQGKLRGIGSQEETFGCSGEFFLRRRYSKEKEAYESLIEVNADATWGPTFAMQTDKIQVGVNYLKGLDST